VKAGKTTQHSPLQPQWTIKNINKEKKNRYTDTTIFVYKI
jgi:hypothetical protein